MSSRDSYIHAIPPRCEVIRHIPSSSTEDSVILAQELCQGIFIAGMIAKNNDGKIPVRILNTTDEEKQIDLSGLEIQTLNNYDVCCLNDTDKTVERVKTLFDLLDLSYLNKEERIGIEKICAKYADVFHLPGDKLTVTNLMEHNITLKENTAPVYVKPYRIPQAQKSEIQRQIQEMLDNDIIEETTSEWSSPVLLVPKKADKSNQ